MGRPRAKLTMGSTVTRGDVLGHRGSTLFVRPRGNHAWAGKAFARKRVWSEIEMQGDADSDELIRALAPNDGSYVGSVVDIKPVDCHHKGKRWRVVRVVRGRVARPRLKERVAAHDSAEWPKRIAPVAPPRKESQKAVKQTCEKKGQGRPKSQRKESLLDKKNVESEEPQSHRVGKLKPVFKTVAEGPKRGTQMRRLELDGRVIAAGSFSPGTLVGDLEWTTGTAKNPLLVMAKIAAALELQSSPSALLIFRDEPEAGTTDFLEQSKTLFENPSAFTFDKESPLSVSVKPVADNFFPKDVGMGQKVPHSLRSVSLRSGAGDVHYVILRGGTPSGLRSGGRVSVRIIPFGRPDAAIGVFAKLLPPDVSDESLHGDVIEHMQSWVNDWKKVARDAGKALFKNRKNANANRDRRPDWVSGEVAEGSGVTGDKPHYEM